MNQLSPFVRQMLLVGSSQLAAFSVGGIIGYPNIILEQFKANDSSIQVDLDISTWIGSVHGLAGIPSVLMPTFMQWKGRKAAFITSCLFIITGWIITFFAKNLTSILTAEAFHGLGANSIINVYLCTISEMTDPKFRLISMSSYPVNHSLGIAIVGIIGRFLHWKTVGIIMGVPIMISLVVRLFLPESPSWLAYRGEFEKCKESFVWLRGTDERSSKELNILINVHKEYRKSALRNRSFMKAVLKRMKTRDFYMPCLQTFVCLSLFYNSGTLVLLIYSMDMIRRTTANESAAFYGTMSIHVSYFFGCFTNALLLKFFNNKPVFLCSGFISALFLCLATFVTFFQYADILPKDSLLCLYCLIGSMISNSLGMGPMCLTVAAELMPVKHRDLGGAFYGILTCLLHFASLKFSPYLFIYIHLWGTLLLFTVYASACLLYIWKYVPETKNRTLQEIEDFYNYGRFIKRNVGIDDVNLEMLELK